MAEDRVLERERHQIELIRQLDLEELQVEEVDDLHESSDEDRDLTGRRDFGRPGELTFDTCIPSLHSYLGEVDDTHHRTAFLDGGAILKLPLFYLEGVVLFPQATLPLRVIQRNFVAGIEKALGQVDAPYTVGVVRVHRDLGNGRLRLATVGTTAEIRQYRRLEDGSVNVVTRGQQRFLLRRCWTDEDGVPYGDIQIIQEDLPSRAPQDALEKSAQFSYLQVHATPSLNASAKLHESIDRENHSDESFENELSPTERRIHRSLLDSCFEHDTTDESTSSGDDKLMNDLDYESSRSHLNDCDSIRSPLLDHPEEREITNLEIGNSSFVEMLSCDVKQPKGYRHGKSIGPNVWRGVSRAFWPTWVYRMYDSYFLAQRAADMWRQIVGVPSMDSLVKKPDLLSFYIASKIPVSESTRQELLEIDGISYRLRREIALLESINLIQCKNCQTVIAKRSDMLVMSSEGPLGAYVNPSGFVHEIMTLYRTNGLALIGPAVTEYSWFPGYSWTIANCATCETQMGWLFTATNKKLKPKSFWGIRSSQVADELR